MPSSKAGIRVGGTLGVRPWAADEDGAYLVQRKEAGGEFVKAGAQRGAGHGVRTHVWLGLVRSLICVAGT